MIEESAFARKCRAFLKSVVGPAEVVLEELEVMDYAIRLCLLSVTDRHVAVVRAQPFRADRSHILIPLECLRSASTYHDEELKAWRLAFDLHRQPSVRQLDVMVTGRSPAEQAASIVEVVRREIARPRTGGTCEAAPTIRLDSLARWKTRRGGGCVWVWFENPRKLVARTVCPPDVVFSTVTDESRDGIRVEVAEGVTYFSGLRIRTRLGRLRAVWD